MAFLLLVIALPAQITFLLCREVPSPELVVDHPIDGILPTRQRERMDVKTDGMFLAEGIAVMSVE